LTSCSDQQVGGSDRPGGVSTAVTAVATPAATCEVPAHETVFDGIADDDEVFEEAYNTIQKEKGASFAEKFDAFVRKTGNKPSDSHEAMRSAACKEQQSLEGFTRAMRKTPRLSGLRVQWCESLGLAKRLAGLLPRGTLFDGLDGVKRMAGSEVTIDNICQKFMPILREVIWKELEKLRTLDESSGTAGVQGVMNKFHDDGGFIGDFGDSKMFHGGLEKRIGYPNPKILLAILREHSSNTWFVTGNYGIPTTPCLESARLVGGGAESFEYLSEIALNPTGKYPKGPTDLELPEIKVELEKLSTTYTETLDWRASKIFAGEAGDMQEETGVAVTMEMSSPEDAKRVVQAGSWGGAIAKRLTEHLFKVDVKATRSMMEMEVAARGLAVVKAAATNGQSSVVEMEVSVPFSSADFDQLGYLERISKALEAVVAHSHSGGPGGLQLSTGPLKLQANKTSSWTNIFLKNASKEGLKDECPQHITDGRDWRFKQARATRQSLRELMSLPEVQKAELRVEEAIAAYQYTGPLFQVISSLHPSFSLLFSAFRDCCCRVPDLLCNFLKLTLRQEEKS
jgi:hypothetical protein